MRRLGVSLAALEKRVKKAGCGEIRNVFLMTLDDCGNQFIQKKEGL